MARGKSHPGASYKWLGINWDSERMSGILQAKLIRFYSSQVHEATALLPELDIQGRQ